MKRFQGLAAVLGALATSAAIATPISGNSLQNTIAGMGGLVDVQNDQYEYDQQWRLGATGVAASRIQFELSAYANLNSFGVYDLSDPGTKLTIFSGADSAGALSMLLNLSYGNFCAWSLGGTTTCKTFADNQFGFFLTAGSGHTFYSEEVLNADGIDHLVAFQGGAGHGTIAGHQWLANEFLLAWEDIYGGGDRDFDDFAVLVESVTGIPEPSTMVLAGIGMLAIGFELRRRRKPVGRRI